MNDKNDIADDKDIEEKSDDIKDSIGESAQNSKESSDDAFWKFCPSCGVKLPEIKRLRYCTKCGLDLIHLKEHKTIPESYIDSQSPQLMAPQQYQTVYYPPFKPAIDKIADEDISNTKDRKLWSTLVSIGIPLLAFVVMNGLILAIMVGMMLFIPNYNLLVEIVNSTYFTVLSSLVELLLILFPILYVRKYLQRPNTKNRFELLGFTRRGYDRNAALKEVLIGLGFAGVGIVLVAVSSLAIELILEFAFNVNIISESDSGIGDGSILVSSADIVSLTLLVLVMILVVGPSEEILFRGFMQRGLIRRLGDKAGLLITALIFALIHLLSLFIYIFEPFTFLIYFLMMFVPYFCISLMLGLMYRWRKENLIAVVITHGVYNSITLILAFLI